MYNMFKVKKLINELEDLTKEEKKKVFIIDFLERLINLWKVPCKLIVTTFYLILYYINYINELIMDNILEKAARFLRDFEITLKGYEELKNKTKLAIKKWRNGDYKIQDEDAILIGVEDKEN